MTVSVQVNKEAANGKGMGDSVHHEENDNDKEQGCQNEEQQSHSPEQREIMEPCICT